MSRNMKTYLIAAALFLVYLGCVIGVAFLIGFTGSRFTIFSVVLALVGLLAAGVAIFYKLKKIDAVPGVGSADTTQLDALIRSAEGRMKQAKGAHSIGAMPLIYILGDENSGKTETVVQSGLDAELLAGQIQRDGLVAPTQLANVWYTASTVIVEAGGTLLRQPGLWYRLISLTAPSKYRAALSKQAVQPSRAAVVCVSVQRLTSGDSQETVRGLGRALNEQLRALSKTLGINLPVYVLFTKLDTIPSFADYVANLTSDEVRDPLGALLAQPESGPGLYVESATAQLSQRIDEMCYSLSEFRLEVLSRGAEPEKLAKAYEFPRELRKLRSSIVDLLVEAGRPSQLGVNPFLRGFYFTGMRARVVEENLAAAAFSQPSTPAPAGDGATSVFSFQPTQAAAPVAQFRTGVRRVPQWVFLPHLFNRVLLADHGALESSRSSTRVNFVKRALIASVAGCLFLYLVALLVSYLNNSALESRLRTAAAVPVPSGSRPVPASLEELQNLEQLRLIFAQVAGYRRNGAPLAYSWGLYPGDRLYLAACSAYGRHFRNILLQPTQSLILAHIAGLPTLPKPTDDYSATYSPFRAYLVTTSNPEKSTVEMEPAGLLEAWLGDPATRPIPPAATDLALSQLQTYSANLAEPESCLAPIGGAADPAAIDHARAFLSHFQGIEQVYLSMKAAADRKNQSIRYNDVFPGTKPYVVDPYEVEGAFTKGGYAFMQSAILHPEPYTSGETWVLGPQTGVTIDRAALNAQLPVRYQADFLAAWRSYLKAAHVVPAATFAEAKEKLRQLDGPSSALMELFQLISRNTAVNNPSFSDPFKAPQVVVPPAAASVPVGTPYMQSLQSLEGAINSMLLIPNSEKDPTAVAPVIQAASTAEGSVSTIRGGFTPPDPVGQTDTLSEALLLAPIKSVEALAKGAPVKAAAGGAAAFCGSIAPLMGKFPFNPDSPVDASVAEIAAVFGPGQAVAQFAMQSKMVTLSGSTYLPMTGSPLVPSAAFLHFLNAAQLLSSTFFPSGGGPPSVAFTLTEEPTPNLAPATLDIDGNTLTAAGLPKSFNWVSSPTSNIRLSAGPDNTIRDSGPWSLFHFAYSSKHPAPDRLEGVIGYNGVPSKSASGIPLDFKFDVSGPGTPFLNPGFMRNQLHCVTRIAQ